MSVSPVSLDRLIGDHDRIQALITDLRVLTRSRSEATEDAFNLLLQLAVQLATHLAYEDEVVDRALLAHAAGVAPHHASTMAQDLGVLRADWHRYIAQWSPQAISEKWEAFAHDTEAMLHRVATQVSLENDLLYAPALRHGHVTLREVSRH